MDEPKPISTRHKLDLIGEDEILSRIEGSETYQEIATSYQVAVSSLHAWLHNDPVKSARVKLSQQRSAEAWMDRGLMPLQMALAKDGNVDSSAAKAYEQACARRAGIRNAKYKASAVVEVENATVTVINSPDLA